MTIKTTRDGVSSLRYEDIMKRAHSVGFRDTTAKDVEAAGKKMEIRKAAIMAPTEKEQKKAFEQLIGQEDPAMFTGKPLSPEKVMVQKMFSLLSGLKKQQQEMNIATPQEGTS